MGKKEKLFWIAVFGLAIACVIYMFTLVGYGSTPVEEVPLWVLWLLS